MQFESSLDGELEKRIEKMERLCGGLARQNRWLKVSLVFLPLITLAAGAATQNQDIAAKTITAERLVIKDNQGRNRVVIETEKPNLTFEMFDLNGARRISLNVMDNGFASMYQHYADGKRFSFGWVTPGKDGKGSPNFAFIGPEPALYASLTGKTPTSSPVFEIFSGDRGQNKSLGKLGGSHAP